MSERTIPMTLPLDADNFLRRECPTCEREFKWHPTQPQDSDSIDTDNLDNDTLDEVLDETSTPEYYYCPYCYEPAALDAWWTKAQLAYMKDLAAAEILGPSLRDFADNLRGLNQPGRLFSMKVDVEMSNLSRPEPLTELDDMVRLDFPCHPNEPIKVDAEWEEEVACLVCGIRYPVGIVRELLGSE